jgi:hypothetical protein
MIVGMFDLESAGDEWTGDNRFFYSFSMWCRKITPIDFDAGAFCAGKATGEYQNEAGETVECEGDSFNGGWVKIFDHGDDAPQTGDVSAAMPNLPFWYTTGSMSGCNQYLWVDNGNSLDYAVNSGSWHADGYDAEKHIFTA